jgi:alanine-synthesizing transaminase
VPGQWAVQTALGGFQSIRGLVEPGGKLFESRQAIIDASRASEYIELTPPAGAMYAFPRVRTDDLPDFDDYQFAMDLLEHKHVLVAPGVSFNVPYRDHFRVTTLPDPVVIGEAMERIEDLLHSYRVSEI